MFLEALNPFKQKRLWLRLTILVLVIFFSFDMGTGKCSENADSLEEIINDSISFKNRPIEEKIDILLQVAEKWRKEKPEDALPYIKKARFLAIQLNEPVILAKTFSEMSTIYSYLGNHKQALHFSKQALSFIRQSDDSKILIKILEQIGKEYSHLGKYHKSLKYLFEGLEKARQTGDDDLNASVLNSIGIIYGNLKEYEESIEYFRRSLTICELTNNKKGMANSMNNIGSVYQEMHDLKMASEHFLMAMKLYTKIDHKQGQAVAHTNLGSIFKESKQFDLSEKHYNKSLEIAESLGNRSSVIIALTHLGALETERKNYNKAYNYLSAALASAKNEKLLRELRMIYEAFYLLYSEQKDYKQALDNYKISSEYKDSIFNNDNSRLVHELQASHEFLEKERENQLLINNAKINELTLQKDRNIRNIVIFILVAILFFLVMLINRYRLKRKTDENLRGKNAEIASINEKLYHLNNELEKKVAERTADLQKEIEIRIKTEKELILLKEKAEKANRLKDVFLSNMSHEVRTPMNGILGFIELLGDEKITGDKRKEYISIIDSSSKYLLNIFNDIIDISKIEADQIKIFKEEFSINSLLDDIIAFYELDVDYKEKKLITKKLYCLEYEHDIVYTDNTRLRQILTNLIHNAIKFTDKGQIDIGYDVKSENELQFFVHDTGHGISESELSIIFERFRQADESSTRRYGGNGLGLAISKGLVELLGGKIWVDSIVNRGSTFFFTVPDILKKAK